MAGVESIDEQLTTAVEDRKRAIDDLIRDLYRIDACTQRIEVLLERRADGEVDPTDQMT